MGEGFVYLFLLLALFYDENNDSHNHHHEDNTDYNRIHTDNLLSFMR